MEEEREEVLSFMTPYFNTHLGFCQVLILKLDDNLITCYKSGCANHHPLHPG